jgi:hypothetical protein
VFTSFSDAKPARTIGIPFTRPERERRLDTSATNMDE